MTKFTSPPIMPLYYYRPHCGGGGVTVETPLVRDLVHWGVVPGPCDDWALLRDTSHHMMEVVSGTWSTMVPVGML